VSLESSKSGIIYETGFKIEVGERQNLGRVYNLENACQRVLMSWSLWSSSGRGPYFPVFRCMQRDHILALEILSPSSGGSRFEKSDREQFPQLRS
jgi:hypothetical protein